MHCKLIMITMATSEYKYLATSWEASNLLAIQTNL